MPIWTYIVLGLLQGLTEFLPVSSKSHLVIAEHWMRMPPHGVSLEVALHLATLLAVLVVYGRDIARLVIERRWGYIGLLALASAVTVAAVWPFKDYLEHLIESPGAARLCGYLLLVTAAWLFAADWRTKHPGKAREPGALTAALTGLAQAAAFLPGISRSGSTIGAGILLGLKREEAARFSFLLSIPAILGAAVLKFGDAEAEIIASGIPWSGLAVAFAVALVSGVLAIYLLLWMLRGARLAWFGWYCLALGITAAVIG